MNSLIARFLLGRGFGKVQEMVSKAVRHGLTTYGGALVASGTISADDMTIVTGAAAVVVGAGLSFLRTFLSSKVG